MDFGYDGKVVDDGSMIADMNLGVLNQSLAKKVENEIGDFSRVGGKLKQELRKKVDAMAQETICQFKNLKMIHSGKKLEFDFEKFLDDYGKEKRLKDGKEKLEGYHISLERKLLEDFEKETVLYNKYLQQMKLIQNKTNAIAQLQRDNFKRTNWSSEQNKKVKHFSLINFRFRTWSKNTSKKSKS